jgi:hypothetical protein
VRLHVKVLDFAWDHELMLLNGGPFPYTPGLDFLRRTLMIVDADDKKFSFGFARHCVGEFGARSEEMGGATYLHGLLTEVSGAGFGQNGWADSLSVESSREFSALFSSTLGIAKYAPYEMELLDSVPVRSSPYRCAPPKTAIFRDMVNELLQRGLGRPSKCPNVCAAFLVPKRDGDFRLSVDYRKVNSKVVFDSYPTPTIEQTLDQFGGAVVLSVLDLNSVYYQIPLSERCRRITAFCTPFGLFEFKKLPMGISVGCQGLSRVVDQLFADLKGSFGFNFVDDLVVYSPLLKNIAFTCVKF